MPGSERRREVYNFYLSVPMSHIAKWKYICKAHLTNLRIWLILPTVKKCERNLSNARAFGQSRCAFAQLVKCAAHLVNPTNTDKMRTKFVKCVRIWPIALCCPTAIMSSIFFSRWLACSSELHAYWPITYHRTSHGPLHGFILVIR